MSEPTGCRERQNFPECAAGATNKRGGARERPRGRLLGLDLTDLACSTPADALGAVAMEDANARPKVRI